MSRLRLNGDDHPEAAHKHLLDAKVLLGHDRPDGAAHLSGYVVECSLKAVLVLQTGKALRKHDFEALVRQVSDLAIVADAKVARYVGPAMQGVPASPIARWAPGMRYAAPAMTPEEAGEWVACAELVFRETVHQMRLDGVL